MPILANSISISISFHFKDMRRIDIVFGIVVVNMHTGNVVFV